jgi:hypothetical protein
MYEKTSDKWMMRVVAYETILINEGVDEGERYIKRYLHKIDRFLDACWKVYKLRTKESEKKGG